jgi:Domain of unknown function (DUF1707)
MPGPGDEIAPGAGGHGHLRASRADREQVIGALKAAFVQGRLAKDEFDLRVSQTFASRTYAELAALTADLPAGLTAAKPSPSARAPGGRAVVRPGRVATAAAALYAGAWTYLLFLAPHPGENPWTRPLILDGTVVCLGIVIFCVAAIFLRRREGRSGGRPPRRPNAGGPAARYLPPAGPDGQLPPADPGHRHAAEAVRRHLPRPPLSARDHCPVGGLAAGTTQASG